MHIYLTPSLALVFILSSFGCYGSRTGHDEFYSSTGGVNEHVETGGVVASEAGSGGSIRFTDSDITIDSAGSFGGDSAADSAPMGGAEGMDGGVDSDASAGADGSVDSDASAALDSGVDASDSAKDVINTNVCCPDGGCLCHGPDPTELVSDNGPYNTDSFNATASTVYYPTDAEPPFAVVAVCGGFASTSPVMGAWGEFYASHGIVAVDVFTGGTDFPQRIAEKLLAAIEELKAENTIEGSPLFGKLCDRYGVMGYSMGGGGAVIASVGDSTLKTSVGLAAWDSNQSDMVGTDVEGFDVEVSTLLLCGTSDLVAPCAMSQGIYNEIPQSIPKMMFSILEASHMSWYGPQSAGGGVSGQYVLAFQKVFLEGDERWRPLLTAQPDNVLDWRTNIN